MRSGNSPGKSSRTQYLAKAAVACATGLCLGGRPAKAANYAAVWFPQGANTNWNVAADWRVGVQAAPSWPNNDTPQAGDRWTVQSLLDNTLNVNGTYAIESMLITGGQSKVTIGGASALTLTQWMGISASAAKAGIGFPEFTQSAGTVVTNNGALNIAMDPPKATDHCIGTYTQTGGWHTVQGSLTMARFDPQSVATYTLSSAGGQASQLSIGGNETIGQDGTGIFTQTGADSRHNVLNGELVLGSMANSTGSYNLTGGGLTAKYIYVGLLGSGTFRQYSGEVTASAGLVVAAAPGSTGNYTLTSGSAQAAVEFVGTAVGGTAEFTNVGGTNKGRMLDVDFGHYTMTESPYASVEFPVTLGWDDRHVTLRKGKWKVVDGKTEGSDTLTLGPDFSTEFCGDRINVVDTPVVANQGTLTISGGANLALSGGSVIDNSGTLDAQADASIYGDGSAALRNSSMFRKSLGSGTTTVSVAFSQTASSTIDTQTGTIELAGAVSTAYGTVLTKTGSATLIISGPQSHGGALSLQAGTTNLNTNAWTAVAVSGAGTQLNMNSNQALAGLTLGAGTAATVTTSAAGARKLLVVPSSALGVASTASIDLTNNAMIVGESSGFDTGLAMIRSGQIASSANGSNMALGIVENGTGVTIPWFMGRPTGRPVGGAMAGMSRGGGPDVVVMGNEALIRYTVVGDANLDGVVDSADLALVNANLGYSARGWGQADFDNDGHTTSSDLAVCTANQGLTAPLRLWTYGLLASGSGYTIDSGHGILGSGAIGRNVTNNGVLTWTHDATVPTEEHPVTGGTTITLADGVTFTNNGTVEADYASTMQAGSGTNGATFYNYGVFRKTDWDATQSSDTSTTTISGVSFVNAGGIVEVLDGTLELAGPVSIPQSQSMTKNGAGTLVISGEQTHGAGATFTNTAGLTQFASSGGSNLAVSVTGGGVVFSALSGTNTHSLASLNIESVASATIDVGAVASIPAVSNEGWLYVHGQATVGDLTGGGRLIVGNGSNTASLSLGQTSTFGADVTVNASAALVWTGSTTVAVADSAAMENRGTVELAGDGGMNYSGTNATPVFSNYGTLKKSAGTGTSVMGMLHSVRDSATIHVQSGTLELAGGSEVAYGATLTKTGSGVLRFSGSGSHGSSGTLAWSAGGMEIAGGATLANGGTLDVQLDGTLAAGTGGGTLANTGTILKSAGSGTCTISAAVSNDGGTMNVQSGAVTLSGALSIPAGSTMTKIGAGTLAISGTQTHGEGATLNVGIDDGVNTPTAGGTVHINTNPGAPANATSNGEAAVAKLAINVREGVVNLNATGTASPLADVHVVRSLTTSEDATGKNARIMLGAGDPLGLGAGGTVFVQAYTGGTGVGNQPSRSDIESTWFQIQTGYYFGYAGFGGITTNAIGNTQKNALALQVYDDADLGGPGAKFIAITSDIIGDLNGDFAVDGADLGGLFQHFNDDPAAFGFGEFTWMEGDFNGDGAVDMADLGMLLGNLGESYDPTIQSMAAASAVPEPGMLPLLAAGAMAILGRRGRNRRKLSPGG